jgi:oligopeptidase A
VETLFHEFGHGLQHMLTSVDVAEVSGVRGVEWDAVELPSQFMENWCYHRETLLGMSRHVDTGAPLPEALFDRVRAARTFRAASMMLRQIYFARLDLELHHRFVPGGTRSILDVQRAVAATSTLLAPLPEDRFLNAFTHIFAGGYAAGYFSYKWAEVLSADAFGAFEDAGLEKPEALAQTGRRFRETVLGLGGSVHPMEVFRRFRGRDPSTAALLRHNGLAA